MYMHICVYMWIVRTPPPVFKCGDAVNFDYLPWMGGDEKLKEAVKLWKKYAIRLKKIFFFLPS